jgi:hypothetical protein
LTADHQNSKSLNYSRVNAALTGPAASARLYRIPRKLAHNSFADPVPTRPQKVSLLTPNIQCRTDAGQIGRGRDAKTRAKPARLACPYNERFNGTLRREVLNAEWFATTRQAQVVINTWLRQYNHIRPHHALGMRPPVPETILEKPQISGSD